ncbi:hypothetical protein ACHHYP_11268 [Achlya hypogyna]|uniref:Secreted protein n=1 Tax=Achlya hypogyna TaxID=1202772 RepID=A0A0A7CP81_ACHHY|nr:secreted protein [Achlya hypogyna]OQR85858.1 hypothetical protein ACHHYP_11268 [Achlya hypogyna]
MRRAIIVAVGVVAGAAVGYESPCAPGLVPFGDGHAGFSCSPIATVVADATAFLHRNLPLFDRLNEATLGFTADATLDSGIAVIGVNESVHTKVSSRFSADVPKRLFLEYVVPYGVTNEGRSDWRTLFSPVVAAVLAAASAGWRDWTTAEAVATINAGIWGGAFGKALAFQPQQTPRVYDVMSMLVFGHASCTGLSIFLVSALRSAGIACRLAGTPAWHRTPSAGNHNWVEVWSPEHGWQFLEAAPAGTGSLASPCDKWFCQPRWLTNNTQFFASRWVQSTLTRFPMAWDPHNPTVPGVNRTDYYHRVCSQCPDTAPARAP